MMENTVLEKLFDQIHPTDEQTMRILQKITQTNSVVSRIGPVDKIHPKTPTLWYN